MYLRGITLHPAPLIILLCAISLSVAHPVPSPVANKPNAPLPLHKRTNAVTISGMTLRGSTPLALILPIRLAASQFESLYANLYQRAVWGLSNNYVGCSSFTLHDGAFEISFVASSGADGVSVEEQAAMMIPWGFVRDFATVMGVMSRRGFTGCYDQGYWDEMGEFGIYVGLRILGPGI